jgi:hypothetical protein
MAGRSDRRVGLCFEAPSRARDNFSHRLPRQALLEKRRAEAGIRAGGGHRVEPPGTAGGFPDSLLAGGQSRSSAPQIRRRWPVWEEIGAERGVPRAGWPGATASECCQQLRAEPGLSGRVEGLASPWETAARIDCCCPGGSDSWKWWESVVGSPGTWLESPSVNRSSGAVLISGRGRLWCRS